MALAFVLVVLGSVALHLWGLVGDLPYAPDIDEPTFMGAAVGMLSHHTLDPHWFGHPGSTVIYPLAALVELWYQAARHLPPFAHPMPGITRELAADPMPFYVIGRLVSAAYGVGSVVITWRLGRRIVGDLGGILAALFLSVTAIAVQFGQILRTDTAGMFFALLTLWLVVRAMETRRGRDWVVAAIAIGLAISSRYFFAILIVPYLVAAALSLSSARHELIATGSSRRATFVPFLGLLAVPLTVFVTSPFLVLDLPKVIVDLQAENGSVHPGADGLSPVGNLLWYIGTVAPSAIGMATLAVAAIGVLVLVRIYPRGAAVLIAFVLAYLAGISASPLHWARYIIPLVPIVAIFAAGGTLAIARTVAGAVARLERTSRDPSLDRGEGGHRRPRPSLIVLTTVAIVVLLVTPSISSFVASAGLRSTPSTRALATDWVKQNLPSDSRIAQEQSTTYLSGDHGRVLRVFTLSVRSLAQYRADGYRYLITCTGISERFVDPLRYPREHAFYVELAATGRLVASFRPGPDRSGQEIWIYDVGSAGS